MAIRTFVIGAIVAMIAIFESPGVSRAQGSDPFLGQMMMVGYQYCPNGWLEANGQLLPINQNNALFSLFGTTFGGNGQTTFALPDMRSRIPVGQGQGPGQSAYVVGQTGGNESVTISQQQMPMHTHAAQTVVRGTENDATTGSPGNGILANSGTRIYAAGGSDLSLGSASATTTIAPAGSNQPTPIMNPYLGMRWCVAMQGIFPSRP